MTDPRIEFYAQDEPTAKMRIATLTRELVEALAGWKSCEDDLRKAAEICRGVEAQLAEARAKLAALEWTKITPENLPTAADEVSAWEEGLFAVYSVDCIPETERDCATWRRNGWTHFRPINAPKPDAEKP